MRTQDNPWVVVVFVLAGVVVGVVASQLTSPRQPAAPVEVSAAPRPSSDELAALRRAIEQLPASLRDQLAPSMPRSPERAPIDASPGDIERLTAAIEQLSDLLARRPGETVAKSESVRAAWASAIGPGYASLAVMGRILRESQQNEEGDAFEKTVADVLRAHMLWTREDVVAHYGPPKAVFVHENSITLQYPGPETTRETCVINFDVMQSFISEIYIDCEDKH